MNYSNIIGDMRWSYSKVKTFHSCPYQFLLAYISKEKQKDAFFANFGSLIHEEMEKYLNGTLSEDALSTDYILHYKDVVKGKAPNPKMAASYFQSGLDYLNDINFPYDRKNVLWVEKRTRFELGDFDFVGVIDCLIDDPDDGLVLLDHKSRRLRQRSPRKKKPPTKSDIELDEFQKQLYLYCIPVKEELGRYPDHIAFNCFRNEPKKRLIIDKFDEEKFEEAKEWAINSIKTIIDNEEWSPDLQYWQCNHICSYNDACEYFQEHDGKW